MADVVLRRHRGHPDDLGAVLELGLDDVGVQPSLVGIEGQAPEDLDAGDDLPGVVGPKGGGRVVVLHDDAPHPGFFRYGRCLGVVVETLKQAGGGVDVEVNRPR
jgi:hypothetical protein